MKSKEFLWKLLYISIIALVSIEVYNLSITTPILHHLMTPAVAIHEYGHAAICITTGGSVGIISIGGSGGWTEFEGGFRIPIILGGTVAVMLACLLLLLVPYARAYVILCVILSLLGMNPISEVSDGHRLWEARFEPLVALMTGALIIIGMLALECTQRDIEKLYRRVQPYVN